jgi:hypothetical protein
VHELHKAVVGEKSPCSADPAPQEVPSASLHVSQADTACQLSSGAGPRTCMFCHVQGELDVRQK